MEVAMNHDEENDRLDTVSTVDSDDDYNSVYNGSIRGSMSSLVGPRPPDRFGFMGGKQYTEKGDIEIPVEVLRKRESKWLEMLDNWDYWMGKKFKKVKQRCRKGIPISLRARAWQYLSGSKKMMERNKGKFDEIDAMPGDPRWVDDIQKDLDRQFPWHEMFAERGGYGQQDLFRVLKAYSIHNTRDGYCQAMAPIAATLLMHMPAEQAFWTLVCICDNYLVDYFSPGLEAVQVDGDVLFALLKKVLPYTYKHLKKCRVEPILYMTEWFMCLFSRTLPWASVLRVWDMIFCEGVKVMFRIALVIFRYTLGRSDQMAQCPGLYEILDKLRNIPEEVTEEEFLVRESLKLRVNERDMVREHQLHRAKRRANQSRLDGRTAAKANSDGRSGAHNLEKIDGQKSGSKPKSDGQSGARSFERLDGRSGAHAFARSASQDGAYGVLGSPSSTASSDSSRYESRSREFLAENDIGMPDVS
ncbi:TBC1 domain family member whacked-like [Saccoglossus kowalevskii]|uniref:TBC1 domain family member 10B-like n=1 Tax=Saccoglossus kowalevskii TaxID=10224 RepID=A0ABM0N042_SACKO|nr:PREDICTED: TBC1 domain family member 10B-like [Saccoglossus kowalevskii]